MTESANSGLAEQFAAALDWWRDAGIDHDWRDTAQSWTAPPQAAPDKPPALQVAEPGPPPPPGLDRSSWPEGLDSFAAWWLENDWLDSAPHETRVPPRGVAGAALMVLVAEPERDDRDLLLTGPQGRLLDAMLAAMGLEEQRLYRASVLPRRMPHADWPALAARGLGDLARHHIALAAPKRLIVFGSHILPLLGHDPTNNPEMLAHINHGGGTVPLLAARDLAMLLERPRWKAGVWQAWLGWTRDAM